MAAPGTIDRAQHGGAGELDTAQWLPLSGHAIDAILDIDDLAVRNLWITQGWANLAGRLGRFFGVDHTWCTFAVWTSSTARRSALEECAMAIERCARASGGEPTATLTIGDAESIARTLLGGSWLLVLGGFMVVGWLASRVAAKATAATVMAAPTSVCPPARSPSQIQARKVEPAGSVSTVA